METNYTTVETILAKFHRDLKGIETNESDVIEWIGESLEFLKVYQIQEQALSFLDVKDYQTDLPCGFQMVLQVAKDNKFKENSNEIEIVDTEEVVDDVTIKDTTGKYNPLEWNYASWTESSFCKRNYTPVRLANNTFFKTLVCKEKDKTLYMNEEEDEYTIVGTVDKKLRFSFKDGKIALAYIKNAIDSKTGYPLIPDDISYITAITYYVKWKIAEMYTWNGREGYAGLAQNSEKLWLKYARQGKNRMKMPKTIDQFQNLLEQSHYLIPRHDRYYGFFGKLGREEDRRFNHPNRKYYGETQRYKTL